MVFCCGELDFLDPEQGVHLGKNNTVGNLVKSSTSDSDNDLVSVTVPRGLAPGETISVMAPDGSRRVKASIPNGLQPGDKFLIRMAKPAQVPAALNNKAPQPNQPNFGKVLDDWLTPKPDVATKKVSDQSGNDTTATKSTMVEEPVPTSTARTPVAAPTQGSPMSAMSRVLNDAPRIARAIDEWLTPTPESSPTPVKRTTHPATAVNTERDEPSITVPSHTQTTNPIQTTNTVQTQTTNRSEQRSTSVAKTNEIKESKEAVVSPKKNEFSNNRPKPLELDNQNAKKVSGEPVYGEIEQADTREEPDHRRRDIPSHVHSPPTSPSSQKLLHVQVPPGMPAGSTIQVEVPGENRTLIAQVPPGVDSFHIAYTPRSQPAFAQSYVPSSKPNQKLLLVRVPPGTAAGTTLHVSVPDEPGRILAAQVPAGNVTEFHVSYEARPRRGSNNSNAPPGREDYNATRQVNDNHNKKRADAPADAYGTVFKFRD